MATQPNSPPRRRWGLSDTGAQVISALLLGLLIGLLIGWVVWPVEWVDADLEDLRPDARAHFVAATADAYVASGGQNPGTALARMQSFSDPQGAVYEAIAYFQQSSDPNRAIREVNLRSLASALDRATTTPQAVSPRQDESDNIGWANWVVGILTGLLLLGGGLWIARRILLNRSVPAAAPAGGSPPPPPPSGGAGPTNPPPRPAGPVWVPSGPSDARTAEARSGGRPVVPAAPGDEIRRITPQSGGVIFETDGRALELPVHEEVAGRAAGAGLAADDLDDSDLDDDDFGDDDLDDDDLDDDGFIDFSAVIPQTSRAPWPEPSVSPAGRSAMPPPPTVIRPFDEDDDESDAEADDFEAEWNEDGGWENDLDDDGDLAEGDEEASEEENDAGPRATTPVIRRVSPALLLPPRSARDPFAPTSAEMDESDEEEPEDLAEIDDFEADDFDEAAGGPGGGFDEEPEEAGLDEDEFENDNWQEREIDAARDADDATAPLHPVNNKPGVWTGGNRPALPGADEDEEGGILPTVQGVLSNLLRGDKTPPAPARSGNQLGLFTAEFNAGILSYAQTFTLWADGKEETGVAVAACGVGISESLDKGAANANQVHLLDVWLYDGVDVRTYNQYLISPGLDTEALAGKAKSSGTITGEPLEIRSGQTFRLATRNFILDCRIVAADFLQRESRPAPLRSVRIELSARAVR